MIELDLSEIKRIVAQYQELEIGYDEALYRLTKLGLTDNEADTFLIPRRKKAD